MMYPIFNVIATSSSLIITKNRDTFFSYLARIETLSVAFPAFKLTPARAVNRFSAVLSIFAKSFF
jgi:hypothetical protein